VVINTMKRNVSLGGSSIAERWGRSEFRMPPSGVGSVDPFLPTYFELR